MTIPTYQRQEIAEAIMAIQAGLGFPVAAIDTRTGETVVVIGILGPTGEIAPVFQVLPAEAADYLQLPQPPSEGENS